MIPADTLLDAFINANILLAVAFGFWWVIRAALMRLGMAHEYDLHRRALNWAFVLILFSPLLMMVMNIAPGSSNDMGLNLSDMAVSYYLNGGFQMKASEFENLLALRDRVITDVLAGAGWGAKAVIGLFVAGLIVGLARLVHSIICLHRIVADSYAWRVFGSVQLRVSDRVAVPFSTRGLRTHFVVLPSHMVTCPAELRVSIAHEFQHLRQGDVTWEILLEVFKPLFFLNPAYHAWKRQVEHLRELACDKAILNRGRIDLRSYCDTLLSVCQTSLRRDPAFVTAIPKVTLVTAERSSRGGLLERRITMLCAAPSRAIPKVLVGAIVLSLLAMTTLTSVAIQRPGDWSHDRLMLSTVVNLERLDEINRTGPFDRLRD